jgi:hypothetical protein
MNYDIGIISALAFCPSYDPSYRLYAAGSLSHSSGNSANIALFDEDTGEKPVGWVGDIKASVTQVRLYSCVNAPSDVSLRSSHSIL